MCKIGDLHFHAQIKRFSNNIHGFSIETRTRDDFRMCKILLTPKCFSSGSVRLTNAKLSNTYEHIE